MIKLVVIVELDNISFPLFCSKKNYTPKVVQSMISITIIFTKYTDYNHISIVSAIWWLKVWQFIFIIRLIETYRGKYF